MQREGIESGIPQADENIQNNTNQNVYPTNYPLNMKGDKVDSKSPNDEWVTNSKKPNLNNSKNITALGTPDPKDHWPHQNAPPNPGFANLPIPRPNSIVADSVQDGVLSDVP
uniref:Uncharacterized protein n=1 Tax=Euplotes crassus TaxID=5936 RepID=A0A7S3KHU9_EUPCR|mmetsp:Transcript_25051/g.24789  ORF Transcript_25051/g.24789 Transcript_25051/m.24789 type:complete len:112 (+) Transcript_25051:402-737(+)